MENSTEPTDIKPLAQPSMTGSTQPKTRMEWSRLLSSSSGTTTQTPGNTQSDHLVCGATMGSALQITKSTGSEGDTTPRFDLGSEGEGGRKAWYVPNERTVFPVKKGAVYRPREKQKREVEGVEGQGKAIVSATEVVAEEAGEGVLWGVTEGEVDRAMRGEGQLDLNTPPRLRRHRSLEEEVRGIEDEESRRLTAIAYLT